MIDTQGKLLVAPPKLPDWRFQKSVIYMWKHDVSGASGVIINKKCQHPDFRHVCYEGGIKINNNIDYPSRAAGRFAPNGGHHSSDRDVSPFTAGDKASQHRGHFPIPAFPPHAARTLHIREVPATEETTRT